MSYKVAVVTEIPAPYRAPVFDLLRAKPGIEFHFIYLSNAQKDRHWGDHARAEDIILPGRQICFPGHHTIYFDQNVEGLVNHGYDLFVLGGYAQPALWKLLRHCWKTGIPYVMMTESHHRKTRSFLTKAIKELFLRKVYGRSAGNLVMGKKARDYVVSYGADEKFVEAFPNTVDGPEYLDRVKAAAGASEQKKPELGLVSKTVVLFVGTLNARKGVDILWEAFQNVAISDSSAALIVVGTGELEAWLHHQIGQHGLHEKIICAGFVPPEELPLYYAMADIFVLPSREEPFGAVVLEAMSAGLPVIVTEEVGAAEDYVVNDVHGSVIPAGSASVLQGKLVELIADAPKRRKMGHASLASMQSWTHEKLAQNVVSLIERIKK